jgi:hypothetical protein
VKRSLAALWLAACAASCASATAHDDVHPCDPRGVVRPHAPSYALLLERELLPPERDLLTPSAERSFDCTLPIVSPLREQLRQGEWRAGRFVPELNPQYREIALEDRELQSACETHARAVAPSELTSACRRACLVDARVVFAQVTFENVLDGMAQVEGRSGERPQCRDADGGDPRAVWLCAGNPWIPRRMRVEIEAGAFRVVGPLVPGTRNVAFEIAEEDAGCGYTQPAPRVTVVE